MRRFQVIQTDSFALAMSLDDENLVVPFQWSSCAIDAKINMAAGRKLREDNRRSVRYTRT